MSALETAQRGSGRGALEASFIKCVLVSFRVYSITYHLSNHLSIVLVYYMNLIYN